MAMVKKFYVTTPIYYVNSEPHMGSVYTTIAADVLARWHRLLGEKVFFLTGTDEHGQKIQETAENKKMNPKEFVDEIAQKFKECFKLLNVSNDNFIRTTDPEHEKEVQKILQELYDKKFIYKGNYEAYYCVGCEQYLTNSDLIDGKCPFHNRVPEIKKEEAYLFKLSYFQDKLLQLIKSGEFCILPEARKKEIITFIESGLQDISISRLKEKVYWGIELPFDKKHTCFVWVDAFWNYLTGLIQKNAFEKFWPADLQLMAKDIIRVHATIWPALLLATNNKLPKTLFVHGYFTLNGKKMSKTLGNTLDPVELTNKYGVDSIRYYLMRNIAFGEDGDVSEQGIKQRHNDELTNKLGNLISRVAGLVEKRGGKITKTEIDENLSSKLDLEEIKRDFEEIKIDKALSKIFDFVDSCNQYIQEKQPWKLEGKDFDKTMYNLSEGIRIIGILISVFLPSTAEKIALNYNFKITGIEDCKFGLGKSREIKKGENLFVRIK